MAPFHPSNIAQVVYPIYSKVSINTVRQAIAEVMKASLDPETKRNFAETIELQIGLKNYDTQRDKRFNGTIR